MLTLSTIVKESKHEVVQIFIAVCAQRSVVLELPKQLLDFVEIHPTQLVLRTMLLVILLNKLLQCPGVHTRLLIEPQIRLVSKILTSLMLEAVALTFLFVQHNHVD